MSGARQVDQKSLEAHLATHRPSSFLKEVLKRGAAHWQLYAALTGSAMAMVTSSAGTGIRETATEPLPNTMAANQASATLQTAPPMRAVRLAMARGNSGPLFERAATARVQANQSGIPVIFPGGVVPVDSTVGIIQPGEWVSIYGTNLASGTAVWNGDFPTILGGTSVKINGRSAFLSLASPGQINLQAPDDSAVGPVSVVVTTSAGSTRSTVTLSEFSPSFLLLDATHVTAIILRSDGSGAYGNGTYDILGPTGNCFGYYTVAARAGDVIEIFGVGFGPTTPTVPAGMAFSGAAPVNNAFSLYMNNIFVAPLFVGLSGAGLYQINLVVPPGLGMGDIPIQASIGGMQTQKGIVFSLVGASPTVPACINAGDGDGGVGDGGVGDGGVGDGGVGDGGGDGGVGDGGVGDGGSGDGGDGGDGDGGDGGDGG